MSTYDATPVALYTLLGVCCGIAAAMIVARTTTGSSTHGSLPELDAIAAMAIGGTRLSGGRGTIVGTVLGVPIFTTLSNVFTLNNRSRLWRCSARRACRSGWRPITLFTRQWADLPFEEMCRLASGCGYDGLEIACWGDHLDVWQAVEDDDYLATKKAVLAKYDLKVWTISNHLKGQAVCDDPIDQRHREILSSRIWGDGDPEGVRPARGRGDEAAEEMKMTARAARRLGVDTVVGFTGSSIWKYVAMFPPATEAMVDAGYEDFANR